MEGNNYVDLVKSLGRLEKGGLLGIENEEITTLAMSNLSRAVTFQTSC